MEHKFIAFKNLYIFVHTVHEVSHLREAYMEKRHFLSGTTAYTEFPYISLLPRVASDIGLYWVNIGFFLGFRPLIKDIGT